MKRNASTHYLLAALLLAITLALGWLNEQWGTAIDVTATKRHSLAASSIKAIESLDGPVDVIAIIGPDRAQRSAIDSLFERFSQYKPELNLTYINPETDPASVRDLDANPNGELILRNGSREQRLQSVSERSVTGALTQLNRSGNRQIAFVSGHDERSPVRETNLDWSLIAERLANVGYLSREISLVSEPRIPESVDVLVLADPRHSYFPGEIASLLEFISNGGNLLWLIETQIGQQSDAGLERIAADLGVATLPGAVIDTASQVLDAQSPDFVLLDAFPAHPVTAALSNPVLLPQATALSVLDLAGQEVLPLLQTPESSWTELGELEGEVGFNPNTDEVAGPLLLGISIERNSQNGQQRFAVIGDADFASSQYLGNGANQALIESLMIWLAGDADALDFVSQTASDSELRLSSRSIVVLSAVLLLGVPLLLLLVALAIKLRRRRAKR